MQNVRIFPEAVCVYCERGNSDIAEKLNSKNSFMNFYLRYCLAFKLFKRQKLYTIRLVILIYFSAVCSGLYISDYLSLAIITLILPPVFFVLS